LIAQGHCATQIAPSMKGQRLYAGAQWRRNALDCRAARNTLPHLPDNTRGALQLLP
jgi:hypothetical protein